MARGLASVSWVALAVAAVPATAQTSEEPAVRQAGRPETAREPGGEAMQDIVVTATRQATNLQDTPIAITAVTSETLQTRALTTTADLGFIVPNAAFRKEQGAYGPGVSAFLRGIGQGDTALSGEPGVAFYIDDIYYPLVFGSAFDLLDLDHVEVLRGPQGTLFGRNALAGAISMVSKKPSLTEASASAEATIGRYNRRDFRTSFSVPLTETLAFGASFLSKRRDGYQRVLDFRCEMIRRGTPELAGSFPFASARTTVTTRPVDDCAIGTLGGEDTKAMRGQIYWKPASNFSLLLTGDYTDQNDEVAADSVYNIDLTKVSSTVGLNNLRLQYGLFSVPGQPAFAYDQRFLTGNPFTTYATYRDPLPAGTLIPGHSYYNGSIFRGGLDYGRRAPLKTWGFSAKTIYGISDDIDLTLVGGYRKLDLRFSFDNDGSPLSETLIFHSIVEDHFTGEARISGKVGWADFVGGIFYYKGKARNLAQPMSAQNGTQRYQNTTYKPDSKAAYANVNLHPFGERLTITGGLRYSDDEKAVDFNNILDATPAGSTVFVPGGPSQSTIFQTVPKQKRFDWKAGLDYKFSDQVMVYASAATGYRLPGFNVRPSQPSQAGPTPGENLISYEIGTKTDLLDRRLRLNLTGFYIDYRSRVLSFSGQEALLTAAGGNTAGNFTVIPGTRAGTTTCRAYNAGTDGARNPAGGVGVTCIARSYFLNGPGIAKGLEAEVEARPFDRFSLNGSLGYTKFTSDDLRDLPETSNRRLLAIPQWTASAGAQYEMPVAFLGGTITPRLDWFYQGSIAYSTNRKDQNQPGFSTFNGRVGYHNEEHDFDVAIGATNLFSKFYYRNKFIYHDLGYATLNGQPAPPREWYLTVRKRF
ncbi:MAG: TonB-dependent receptor [Sphingomonas fennica]